MYDLPPRPDTTGIITDIQKVDDHETHQKLHDEMVKSLNKCQCEIRNRQENETQREWLKDSMCMFHWMQSDYYVTNAHLRQNIVTGELLDLITLMPDSQTQEIVDYITKLRETRNANSSPKT